MDRETSLVTRAAWVSIAGCLLLADSALAAGSSTVEEVTTPGELFSASEAAALAHTLPANRRVTFRVRRPPDGSVHGVLVFVSPRISAEPQAGWPEVLDRRNLIWIAAEKFGNDRPSAQRVLVALMALKHLERAEKLETARIYIGGMSGGGRIASQALARFPQFFAGALCIVGADFVAPAAQLAPGMSAKRVVFMTGDGDFNRREIRDVYTRFLEAGVTHSHLIDLTGFAHQYPDAAQLDAALELLDRR